MKILPVWLAAACALLCMVRTLAAPPQPVIQLPRPPSASPPPATDPLTPQDNGRRDCLGDGTGYVRARIRGAFNSDLDWHDTGLQCGGDARPDGSGLRVSFAGPGPGGKVLRLVFGVSSAVEGRGARELPTNLTVLMDGGRVFSTEGDDKCTLDRLQQVRLPGAGEARAWRIEGHGFCVTPANAVLGKGRILVSRFDFAGRIEFSGRATTRAP